MYRRRWVPHGDRPQAPIFLCQRDRLADRGGALGRRIDAADGGAELDRRLGGALG
jgi:hypothetical protein